jgi:hypothetical protein
MTTEEILEVADQYLEYSDFGNFYGSEDSIVEFAAAIMRKAEMEE